MRVRVPAGVRVGGESVGGRFTSLDGLIALADNADDFESILNIAAGLDYLITTLPASRASSVVSALDAVTLRLDSAALDIEEPEPEELPDVSDEWEIAFDYNSKKGASSDVDINIRIHRTDGTPFGLADAQAVMRHLQIHQMVPVGFEVAGIDWRRPRSGSTRWRRGDVSDLASFYAPMYTRGRDATSWEAHKADDGFAFSHWRFGSVKR